MSQASEASRPASLRPSHAVRVDVLTPADASPSSVAITFEVLAIANRLAGEAGRPAVFAPRAIGSGASAAAAFLRQEVSQAGREPADLVVVPGLAWTADEALAQGLPRPDLRWAQDVLAAAAASGAEVAASGSGVFMLAEAGLLQGRRATTSAWLAPAFRRRFPGVTLEAGPLVIRDGRVVTAGAVLSQLDLMLATVARHAGPQVAARCADRLVVDQRRGQVSSLAIGLLSASDPKVAAADAWIRTRLHEPLRVHEIAAAVGLSPRTFARRVARAPGLSPLRFVQRLRLDAALELLATMGLSLEAAAYRVGYAEPSTLRKLLRAEGLSSPRRARPKGGDPAFEATSRRIRGGCG